MSTDRLEDSETLTIEPEVNPPSVPETDALEMEKSSDQSTDIAYPSVQLATEDDAPSDPRMELTNENDQEVSGDHNDKPDASAEEEEEEGEEDDDDYDPEGSVPLADEPPASNDPTPDALIQSILSEYTEKNLADTSEQSTSSSGAVNTSSVTANALAADTSTQPPSVDLNKLLSSIGTVSKPEATSSKSYPPPFRDLDRPQTQEEIEAYQSFLREEQEYVAAGRWDAFPYGSRMFVGNLPTDRVSKAELYRIFIRYGRIAQIAMKRAYGFIQFHDPQSVTDAIANETSAVLKGNTLHLEISKPQVPRGEKREREKRIRSRSPQRRDGARSGGRNRDREGSRNNNGRGRRNSPNRGGNRYRERTPSPERNFLLPRRASHQVPDCQIFILDRVDRSFVFYVEKGFKDAGINVSIDDLPSRVPVPAAIQQMAYEGVLGVVTLDYGLQRTGQVNIQVFDRSQGGSVRFDEYLKIDLSVAVELINRAKRQQHPSRSYNNPSPPTASYGHPQPPHPPQHHQPDPTANLIGTLQNMDPTSLQKLVSALQQTQQQQPMPQQNYPPSSYSGYPQYSNVQASAARPPPTQSYPYGNVQSYPNYPAQPSQGTQGQSTQQVQNIMEQLAKLQGQVKH